MFGSFESIGWVHSNVDFLFSNQPFGQVPAFQDGDLILFREFILVFTDLIESPKKLFFFKSQINI